VRHTVTPGISGSNSRASVTAAPLQTT